MSATRSLSVVRNLLVVCLLVLPGLFQGCTSTAAPGGAAASGQTTTPGTPSAESISVVAVGDVMPGTDYPEDALPQDNGRQLFAPVRQWLTNADITFGNLEDTLMDGGEPEKTCEHPDLCFLFRTPTRFAATLAWAGFDVMSLANNHSADFGEEGRSSSMRALDAVDIAHAGRIGDVANLTVKGLKVAVIGFAPNKGCYSINDIPLARRLVHQLAETHDLVFVSFHGGGEGPGYTHVKPGMELFHGEERGDVVAFAHAVVEAGADLVLGQGPHVPRAMEVYQGHLIAYSLGNFATWWGIGVGGAAGYAPVLRVTLAANGRFLHGRIDSATQSMTHSPQPDPDSHAFKLIRQLTEHDLQGGGLVFTADGNIRPAQSN
jgi:hypothetical protein